MSTSRFDAKEMSLGSCLKEGYHFIVPVHQRDYRWTEDEIEQFFIDISDALTQEQEEYFIGLMVFMKSDSRQLIILDGQQRIATTLIILSSIKSWLINHDYDEDANQIQLDYISIRELGVGTLNPRMVLNENNNPYFHDYVIHVVPLEDIIRTKNGLNLYDQNRPLLDSIIYCRNYIDEMVSSLQRREEKAAILFNFTKYLTDNVKIVRFIVPNDSNAYTIFETLNDRGLALSILDLIKNHIFGIITDPTRIPEIQRRWNQMMSHLTNVPPDNFFKVYWTSRHGRTQKNQLFSNFKSNIRSIRDVSEVTQDMLNAAEQYEALENPYDPVWPNISEDARKRIRALSIMDAKQVHPVLLSALNKFTESELERLLKLLEVLIVRYQLIGGKRTGRLEISCAKLASDIYNEVTTNVSSAHSTIGDIFPSDDEFKISFNIKQEKNAQKIRYILSSLEIEERRRRGQALGAELQAIDSLTIEHILPKRPSSAWNSVLQADTNLTKDGIYALGNMCLLGNVNRALGNKAFNTKKQTYSDSNLYLTKMVDGYRDWNRDAIINRQQHLANLATSYWRWP